MSRDDLEITSNISDLPGDPNCPLCKGIGYLRRDLPVGHPEFGKYEICDCRKFQVAKKIQEHLYAFSGLEKLQHLTFDTFKANGRGGLGEIQINSLETACNQARMFAQSLNGWLLFQGSVGCGKTHLAAAIANYVVSLGVNTIFLTAPELLQKLRSSYFSSETTFEQQFEEIRNIQLLVIDDFGTQNATDWAQEQLFLIINYRYINHLPTVITTNLSLNEIEQRIRSRLLDPELVTNVQIYAPDYRRPKETGHPEISSLGLSRLSKCTFGNFSLRRDETIPKEDKHSLEKAFNACRDFAKNPEGWLILTGANGCGKTHLAAAIGNYRTSLGDQIIFETIPNLLDHLRETFGPDSLVRFDQRFSEIRNARLLILDDLSTQSMTPWAREKLYQLLDYRFNDEKPTVITTAEIIDNMDARIRSRLLNREICTIYGITTKLYAPLNKK